MLVTIAEVWKESKMRALPSGSVLSSPLLPSVCQSPDPFFPHLNSSKCCSNSSWTSSGHSPLSGWVPVHMIFIPSLGIWKWDIIFQGFLNNVNSNKSKVAFTVFNILLSCLTSVPDGGCAGAQHVSRSRDPGPRKKKRLRFQVHTFIHYYSIWLWIVCQFNSLLFILMNIVLGMCHNWE